MHSSEIDIPVNEINPSKTKEEVEKIKTSRKVQGDYLNYSNLDYKDKIEFVFISNEEFSVINEFVSKKGYTFDVYKPITKYPRAFDVKSIPRTFLIAKNGRIVIDKTGAANWNSKAVRNAIEKLIL